MPTVLTECEGKANAPETPPLLGCQPALRGASSKAPWAAAAIPAALLGFQPRLCGPLATIWLRSPAVIMPPFPMFASPRDRVSEPPRRVMATAPRREGETGEALGARLLPTDVRLADRASTWRKALELLVEAAGIRSVELSLLILALFFSLLPPAPLLER